MKKLLSALCLFVSLTSLAGPPIIWNGDYAKLLPMGGLQFGGTDNKAIIDLGTIDPSVTGFAAPVGSVGATNISGVGSFYVKSGPLNTQWVVAAGAGVAITALTGDVSATGPGSSVAVVNSVGTSSAASVHSAELLANASTHLNTPSVIVKRDSSGNFSAGTISANLTGNVTGDVTGNTSGTASNVTGVVALANGGTGQSAAQAAMNSLAGAVTSTQYLRGDGANVVMSAIQAGDVPTLNQNTTGTASNVTGVVALTNGGTGQSTAQAGMNALAGAVTATQYLRGDGSNVSMSAIQASDVPTLNQNTTGTAANVTGIVALANGGTGQSTALAAKNALGTQDVFNGLEDPTLFTVTYNSTDKQFTVTYTGTAYVTVNGVRYAKSGSEITVAHAANTGLWYCYYNSSGVLTATSAPWDILTTAQLASVYYNATTPSLSILYGEKHSGKSGMSNGAHKWAHRTIGTRIYGGGTPSGYTLNTSGAASLRYAISEASLADEDIYVTSAALIAANTKRVWYKIGAAATPRWDYVDDAEGFLDDGTNIYYNQNNAGTWQQTAMGNGYVNYWLFATTADAEPRFGVVMGQNTYASQSLAQAATFGSNVSDFSKLTDEAVILYQMVYQRSNAFGAPGNARLVAVTPVNQSIVGTGTTSPSSSASNILTDITNFGGRLSATDTNVQLALDTLDDSVTTVTLGGTGASTATAALTNLLPSQTGNTGKALVTDGSSAAWSTVSSSTNNKLTDPGFEAATMWTASGAGTPPAATSQTTAANVGEGAKAMAWNSDAAAQYLTSAAYAVEPGLYGKNGAFYCSIQTPTGTATHTLEVTNGTITLSNSTAVASSTAYTKTGGTFVFPSSGSVYVRFASVAADEPAINIDSCYLGLADGTYLTNIQQLGPWTDYTPTKSAGWGTVTGEKVQYRRNGSSMDIRGGWVTGTVTSDVAWFDLPAGLTADTAQMAQYGQMCGISSLKATNGAGYANNTSVAYNIADAHIEMVGRADGTAYNAVTGVKVNDQWINTSEVEFFCNNIPITQWKNSEQAFTPDTTFALSRFNFSGTCRWETNSTSAVFPAGDATCTYAETENGIPIASIVDGTGVQQGITFTPPTAGWYKACFFSSIYGLPAASQGFNYLYLDDTEVLASGLGESTALGAIFSTPLCSPFYVANNSAHTLKVYLKAPATGSVYSNDGQVMYGYIEKMSQNIPAPLLVGSVTSTSLGLERVERFTISTKCTSSPCTLTSNTPGITSVTRAGTGSYYVNFSSGTFFEIPTCVGNAISGGTFTTTVDFNNNYASTTKDKVYFDTLRTDTAANADATINMICMGAR